MFTRGSTTAARSRRIAPITPRLASLALVASLIAACHRDVTPPVTITEPSAGQDALLGPTAYRGVPHTAANGADFWKAGRVEVCEYDVTPAEAGQTMKGVAIVRTRQILADPVTKTRATNDDPLKNRPALERRVQFDVGDATKGTRVATTVFVGVSDAKSLKLEVSVLGGDGGAFKWFVNHKGTLEWHQFSDLPGTGHTSGTYQPPDNFAFEDALPLVLRRLYASVVASSPRTVGLLASQASPRPSPSTPMDARIECGAPETVDSAIGKIEARKFTVTAGVAKSTYWLAANAPELGHAMIRHESSDGTVWTLRARRWVSQEQAK